MFSTQIGAEDVVSKSKELTGLQAKIKKIDLKLNGLDTQKNKLLIELKTLDEHYGKSAVLLKNLQVQINKLHEVLKNNQQQMTEKRLQIDGQKHELENQVKAAYGMGRSEKLKLLLNQQDPSLSGRMLVYYDYLNKYRLEKITKIKKDFQILQKLELERGKESALLEKKVQKRKLEDSVILETKAERKILLTKINQRLDLNKQQLNRFKVSEKKLKALIISLQKVVDDFPVELGSEKEFAQLQGKLSWPVKGKLVREFGAKRSDSRWDGVLIKAKEGDNIRAVTRGRVVFADWLRGYGLLIIIDHGKGFMTLYAFNQSLYKSVGDWVDVGTVIATVGQSGGQSDVGLYFGIRKKGKPVNPLKWCKKIRHGRIG